MAKINNGKRFENNFKNSVPSNVFCYRFKDGTANFNGARNINVRFQAKNICDFMLFDGKKLFLLELKSHKGKSLPLSCVRPNQIAELYKASIYTNVVSGIIIHFSDLDEIYFIEINKYIEYVKNNQDKKSIPILFLKENGILIECEKKEINIKLKLNEFINNC